VPGNGFALHGHNIKVEGGDPACGVYLVPAEDPSQKVKITRILENSPSKIMGLSLATGFLMNRIEVVTQFSGGSAPLKTPRTVTSAFMLEEI